MNFGFTEEQELLRKTARDFLAEHAPMKRVREVMEGDATYASDVWKQMAELGWTGLTLPESLGGAGLGLVELAIVLEELGRGLTPVPFLPTAIASDAIASIGSDAQRADSLPRIAAGDAIATLAVTEEKGTEEPADLSLIAAATKNGFALDGSKLFVPDAEAADLLLVVARIGGEAERGLGLFLVPRETPGVRIEPMRSTTSKSFPRSSPRARNNGLMSPAAP